jgi:hypothetical protein
VQHQLVVGEGAAQLDLGATAVGAGGVQLRA